MDAVIAKGFGKPTQRVQKLKDMILDCTSMVEMDRAILVTEAYKETEGLTAILRRGKVNEKIFNNLPVTIREGELLVGTATINPRSSQLGVEYSCEWLIPELDTMDKRLCDRFSIKEEDKAVAKEIVEYWKGKTMSEYAYTLMSPECRDAQEYAVFNAGNYMYAGVGHVCPYYEKVLQVGYKGFMQDILEAMEKIDTSDPESIHKMQFYRSCLLTLTAAINFSHRYADEAERLARQEMDPKRRKELEMIAQNCRRVPENPATNFWEAMQSFWFTHCLINIEANGHSVSPGAFDRYMYPYLRDDKNIDREFAQELLDSLFVKFNDQNKIRDDVSAQAFAGYQLFEMLCLGGTDEIGRDQTNELSYMCLESLGRIGLPMPSVGIRVGTQTPDELLLRACEVIRLGYGMPNIFNDEIIIPALVNRGVPLPLARTYTIEGCVEPDIPHKYYGWHDAAAFNVAHVLDITLNNGRCYGKQLGPKTGELRDFKSIEEVIEAFDKQMEYFVKMLVEADNCIDQAHADRVPLPFESILIEGCIEKGKSSQEGGALYNFSGPQGVGVVDAGDSLYCIQKNVFEDKKFTMAELQEALENNFGYPVPRKGSTDTSIAAGEVDEDYDDQDACLTGTCDATDNMEDQIYDAVRAILSGSSSVNLSDIRKQVQQPQVKKSSNKYDFILNALRNTNTFGNDIDEIDQYSVIAGRVYSKQVEKHKNIRGGQFQAGMYPVSANVLYGKDVGPLPTGRLAKEPLADGVSPRAGRDVNGPTSAANSVAKLDHAIASNGTLYNQKFSPSALAGDKGLTNLASLIRGYFERKGMHIQFNCVDRATLEDAQKHPERHKDLVIRVAGYSAQFIGLAKEVQDNIIQRTEMSF